MERYREKLREELAALLEDSFTDTDGRIGRGKSRRTGERYFTPNEQAVLTSDARGYLLQLVADEQISRLQMELILHYVLLFWTAPVDVRDLEDLLDQVVFGMMPEDLDMLDPWDTAREH